MREVLFVGFKSSESPSRVSSRQIQDTLPAAARNIISAGRQDPHCIPTCANDKVRERIEFGNPKSQARHRQGVSFPQRIPSQGLWKTPPAPCPAHKPAPVSTRCTGGPADPFKAFRLQEGMPNIRAPQLLCPGGRSLTAIEDVGHGGSHSPTSSPSPLSNQCPGSLSPPTSPSRPFYHPRFSAWRPIEKPPVISGGTHS